MAGGVGAEGTGADGAGPDDGAGSDVPVPSRPALTEAPELVTASVRVEGFPGAHLPILFDGVFSRLFPALGQAGVEPVGAAYSLYSRVPADTVDLEVGIPVDRVLDGEVDLGRIETPDGGAFALVARASAKPGGRIATAAHLGGYDRLGEAWQTFIGALEAQGERVAMPFWEVYTTEPTPDMDPATLRTDLFTVLEG